MIKTFRDIFWPIQDVIVDFLNKLQEANKILGQPVVVSSVIDEFRNKQSFSKLVKLKMLKDLIVHTTGLWEI